MKFQETKLDNGRGRWTVTVDGTEWADALKKARKDLIANIEIKGFRKGKAPMSEIEKELTPSRIYQTAIQMILDPAFMFAINQKDAKLQPFTTPIPTADAVDDNHVVVNFDFEAKPEITLGNYKGLKIENLTKQAPVATDEEINDVLKQYQERFAMETAKPEKAKIAKGDVVTFDFTGYVDGKPFDGGHAEDYKLEIGSNSFIPGFEDAMIGLTRGDNQSINVTFPAGYSPELSGKPAEFKLNIKEIATKELPKLDDDLALDLALPEVKTLAALKEHIQADIVKQKAASLKNGYVDRVLAEILKNSDVQIPQTIIQQQKKHLLADFEQTVQKEGMNLEEYKKTVGIDDAEFNKQLEADATNELATYLVTSEIIAKENLDATEEEVNNKFKEFHELYGIPEDQLKTLLKPEQVSAEIVNEKLINFLYENN